MCDREVHSKEAFRRIEGAGGSLTVYDTEESPLSKICLLYTSDAVRFYYRADLPRSPALTGPLASWRGDFPQCRTLSVTLLLPRIFETLSSNELLGHRY